MHGAMEKERERNSMVSCKQIGCPWLLDLGYAGRTHTHTNIHTPATVPHLSLNRTGTQSFPFQRLALDLQQRSRQHNETESNRRCTPDHHLSLFWSQELGPYEVHPAQGYRANQGRTTSFGPSVKIHNLVAAPTTGFNKS